MIDKINEFEKECNSKTNKTSQLKQNNINTIRDLKQELSKYKNEFRETNIAVKRIKEMTKIIQQYLDENQFELEKIQNKLLIEKKCNLNIKSFNFSKDIFADFQIIQLSSNSEIFNSTILTNVQAIDLLNLCRFKHESKFNLL